MTTRRSTATLFVDEGIIIAVWTCYPDWRGRSFTAMQRQMQGARFERR